MDPFTEGTIWKLNEHGPALKVFWIPESGIGRKAAVKRVADETPHRQKEGPTKPEPEGGRRRAFVLLLSVRKSWSLGKAALEPDG